MFAILIERYSNNHIMKTSHIYFGLVLLFASFSANAQTDRVIGIYFTPNKDGKVSIYKAGNKYYGKLIWGVKNITDAKNPNPVLRNRKLVGSDFMTGFKYDDGEYVDGKIYDPGSGKTYDCKMWLEGNKLKVRGFMGISTFGRTETFTRTNS